MAEYEYAATDGQTSCMAEVKALHPDYAWFQVWPAMLTDHGDEFQDNGHDIYVLMNNWPIVAAAAAKSPPAKAPAPAPAPATPGVKKA